MGSPKREWVIGWVCLGLELGGLFYRGFIVLKQVQMWVTTQKCYTDILICNLAKCWGPSSVANKIGASSFCRVLMRTHLGFLQMLRAHDLWLSSRRAMAVTRGTGQAAGSVGRGALPPPDSSAHYRGRRGEIRAGCAKLEEYVTEQWQKGLKVSFEVILRQSTGITEEW